MSPLAEKDWREGLVQGDRIMCQLGPETEHLAFGAEVNLLIWKTDDAHPPTSVSLRHTIVNAPLLGTVMLLPEHVIERRPE